MFDHYYVLEELQKQRAMEIKRQVVEAKRSHKKPLICYLLTFKGSKQCG
jgi:hypothetical protein